ncbi:MAG: hypothetical protein H0U65_05530 [Rubrobacter sp.]|jgi:hypothetical protein|nr:hypothetical protein [Rubrobacter sp.]
MSEQLTIERHGHRIKVEFDDSLVVVYRVRLFINGKLADERSTMSDARLRGELRVGGKTTPVKAEITFGFLGDIEKCVLIEDGVEQRMRPDKGKPREYRPEPAPPEPAPPTDKEGELLAAMDENGGRVSAMKAAMETSISVKEAEGMLSELASDEHLFVELSGGAMIYALPGNEPEGE